MMTIKIGQLLIDKEHRDDHPVPNCTTPLAMVIGKNFSNDGVPFWTVLYSDSGQIYRVTYDMLFECYDILP